MKPKQSSRVLSRGSKFTTVLMLSILLAVFGTPALFGQINRAVLEGTVTDPSGAAIVGADVKILAVDTGIAQDQRTNSRGYYRFPGLAVGRYTVTVSNVGCKTKIIEGVDLQVGQTRTLDSTWAQFVAGPRCREKQLLMSDSASPRLACTHD